MDRQLGNHSVVISAFSLCSSSFVIERTVEATCCIHDNTVAHFAWEHKLKTPLQIDIGRTCLERAARMIMYQIYVICAAEHIVCHSQRRKIYRRTRCRTASEVYDHRFAVFHKHAKRLLCSIRLQ